MIMIIKVHHCVFAPSVVTYSCGFVDYSRWIRKVQIVKISYISLYSAAIGKQNKNMSVTEKNVSKHIEIINKVSSSIWFINKIKNNNSLTTGH